MLCTATLVVTPENSAIIDDYIQKALHICGATADSVTVLDHGRAADIDFLAAADMKTIYRDLCAALPQCDLAVQKRPRAPIRLFLADMDSTMIREECIDELADFVGKRAEISAVTARAMRGELAFEEALRARVGELVGLSEDQLEACYRDRITLMEGGETLLQTLKSRGIKCLLVSGGFTFFTARVAARLGFDDHKSNQLEIDGGALTGRVIPPICGADTKLAVLNQHRRDMGIDTHEIMAIGDGANDIPMLQAAGLGIAHHGKPKTAEAVCACIRTGDLTSALYFMGLRADQFV